MKKEVKDSLRHIQSHPTTGTPHNANMNTVMVETAFAIDDLTTEVVLLKDKIVELDSHNGKLERVMVWLTVVTAVFGAFEVIRFFVK
jgi:hypothetical protein